MTKVEQFLKSKKLCGVEAHVYTEQDSHNVWTLPQLLKDFQRLLLQTDVSGWQEFEIMPPNVGDTVLVKSKRTGRLQIWEIKAEDFNEEYLKAYCWTYPPA